MYVSKQPRIWRGNVCWSQWVTFLCSTVVTWGHRGICSAHKDVCKPLIPSRHALRMTFVLCSLVALRNKVLQRPYTVTLLIRAHRFIILCGNPAVSRSASISTGFSKVNSRPFVDTSSGRYRTFVTSLCSSRTKESFRSPA